MKSFTEMMADIDAGRVTMADVDTYISEMEAARAKDDAEHRAVSERAARAHAELARKQAIENRLRGQTRISHVLKTRK